MTYRVLVDENTSHRVAEILRGKGHDALHIHEALEEGVRDERISEYAETHGYAILTHDDDFLLPEHSQRSIVLYYSDDTLDGYEIADRVDSVVQYVPDMGDLPPITNIGAWE